MADLVMTDPFISLGGTDYSSLVTSVTLSYEAELVDSTAGGATTRVNLGGLKSWSLEVEFKQNFADNGLDEVLFGLVGTSVACIFRPVASSLVGASNPNYTGSGILASFPPIGQAVGELAKTTVRFEAAGALSRAVA